MTRATKIVATLGPASSDPAVLERLLRAGVDVVRLNFSHGTAADHIARAELVRAVADKEMRAPSGPASTINPTVTPGGLFAASAGGRSPVVPVNTTVTPGMPLTPAASRRAIALACSALRRQRSSVSSATNCAET